VEEDAAVFIKTLSARLEDGWTEALGDTERRLRVMMGPGASGSVKSALSNGVVGRKRAGVAEGCVEGDVNVSVEEAFSAVADLRQYGVWDYSWQRLQGLGHIDAHNSLVYFVADSPPMPMSFVITQRDFCTVRLTLRLPSCRTGLVVYRNAAAAGAPLWPALIRGEVVGVIGFAVRPLSASRFFGLEGGGREVPGANIAGSPPLSLSRAAQSDGLKELDLPETPVSGESALASKLKHAPGPLLSVIHPPSWVGQTHIITTARADPKGTIPPYLVNFVAFVKVFPYASLVPPFPFF